jgi:deoxyribonuclease-4
MLLFGTAGIPHSAPKRDTVSGIRQIKTLGLDAMELEFVHGVNLSPETAKRIGDAQKESGIQLTVHAPYFINLNSPEQAKYKASIKRILDSGRMGFIAGAKNVTFHAGFYLGGSAFATYKKIKEAFKEIIKFLDKEKIGVRLTPELTGKATQFGSLEELVKLAGELDSIGMCLDISHLHSRTNGKYNSLKEFNSIWKLIQKKLGKSFLDDIRIHISGIQYTAKGERMHLNLKESDFNYGDFIKSLLEYKIGGILICESPNLEEDALLLKKIYLE